MSCFLVVLDKLAEILPVGIGETLHKAIAKLVMREVGDQAKTACGSIQLCAGLESGIEGATHDMTQRRWERNAPVPGQRAEEESEEGIIESEDDEVRVRVVSAVGGLGELQAPQGGWQEMGE